MIEFFVPGIPKTAGSKRAFVNPKTGRAIVTEDCRRSKDWQAVVAHEAAEEYSGPLLHGPLWVRMHFWLPRPKAHYHTGKRSGLLRDVAPEWHAKRPDALKMARAVEDALTGVLWVDDAQIADERLTKHYGERPGVVVRVQQLEDKPKEDQP